MSTTSANRRVTTFDVFVGNLPQDVDQKKIGKVFSKFGEIHSIWISSSSDGNKFAFVKFYCEEDSLKAIEETNGTLFEGGKPIHVKKANKRGAKRDGDQEGIQDKEEGKAPAPLKQGNSDLAPPCETSIEQQLGQQQMKKDTERIMVSFVETPIVMWGQKLSEQSASDISSISEQLAIICPEAPTLAGKPEIDKIYGAQYTEDGQWYRCSVRYVFGSDRVKVQYIDFGNTEELNPSSLVELPKSLTVMPVCSIKYMLHSLWCKNQDQAAIKFLKDMVEGQEVEVFTTARLSDHTGFFAEVYSNGVNICEKMVENGFCYKKPGLDQRGLKARLQGAGGDATGLNSAGIMKGGFGLRDGPRKFETDKDEITNLRWKLKNLQTEYTSLSNKAQENNMSYQIKLLQVLSSTVRKLRNQFPVERETPLDMAISLVQDPDKIDISMAESLPEVVKSVNAYKNAQDEILKCSDSSVLKEKVEARDQVRRELYQRLGTTIEELKVVPLQDRGKQVQTIVATLTKHYDNFMKLPVQSAPSIDSLLPAYTEWKTKKMADVVGARRLSDTMESTVKALFGQLSSQLSLDPELEVEDPAEDFDSTLKTYAQALQQECAMWDCDNNQDTLVIGSLVQCLIRELKEESSCVEHLTNVLAEFTVMREQVAPWLDATPSLDDLQAVLKKLKTLKSKLRHKLADKADAEENHDTEELETIADDLEDIRSKIHKSLKEEDEHMSKLSSVANAHFPELLSSDCNNGLGAYLTYKGLVKLSHSPDHYTLTPTGSSSSGMYVSQFDGEPVYIKEYFLSDGNHLDKEEFLSQMALFTNASSSQLEPVHAVFFDKNNRHAYVQVKKEGELLTTSLEQMPMTKQQCQSVVRSLCVALQGLHLFNFVHGQIQPDYVTVDETGSAKLLPADFSLTDADRCRSRYTTDSGLEMTAPEMKQTMLLGEPSHATDVYCLGLLTLWMHHPNFRFTENKNGVVDISSVPLDRNLGIFLTKLLCPNPMLRPTAENCLRSEYLNQEIIDQQRQSPMIHMMYGGKLAEESPSSAADLEQQARNSRNSASPASSSDGLVFADSGAGIQMIANTRIPPPPIVMDNQMGNMAAGANISYSSASPQQPGPTLTAMPPQQQHLSFQQQFQHQEQQQLQPQLHQNQQVNPVEQQHQKPVANGQTFFEIGTFDPTAHEVVTSPQASTATSHDDETAGEWVSDEDGDDDDDDDDVATASIPESTANFGDGD